PHDEPAAVPDAFARRLDRSAVQGHDLTSEREPDAQAGPGPLEGAVDLLEEAEDRFQLVGRNADADVGHGEHDVVALARHVERDAALRRRILGRVVEEVADHLAEARRVALDVNRRPRQGYVDSLAFGIDDRRNRLQRIAHDLADGYLGEAQIQAAAGD